MPSLRSPIVVALALLLACQAHAQAPAAGLAAHQPPPHDQKIQPGDLLAVSVYELRNPSEDYVAPLRVAETGTIRLPFLGEVDVEGMTGSEARDSIRLALVDQQLLIDAQVRVQLRRSAEQLETLGEADEPLTPGDTFVISVYELKEVGEAAVAFVTVDGDGRVELEVVGKFDVAGKRMAGVESLVISTLADRNILRGAEVRANVTIDDEVAVYSRSGPIGR